MTTSVHSDPQRIYLERVTDPNTGDILQRKLWVVYPNPEYPNDESLPPFLKADYLLTKIVNGQTIYYGIKMAVDVTGKLTITYPASELTSYLVKSTVLFEFGTQRGDVYAGKLDYSCEDPTNDEHLCLKGESNICRSLVFGPKNELHLSIIGVDDIRARSTGGGNVPKYSQLYAMHDQTLFIKVVPIIGTANSNIVIQYKKY